MIPASRPSGFTTIELAIVLLIAGILLAIGIPAVEQYLDKSRLIQATIDIGDLGKAIKKFEREKGRLPATLAEADVGLVSTIDPWGRPYVYLDLRTANPALARQDRMLKPLNSDFDLYSMGPDGLTQPSILDAVSRDDVVRARDGSFVGTSAEFDP